MRRLSKRMKGVLVFLGTLLACALLILFVSRLEPAQSAEAKPPKTATGMPVSVRTVVPQVHTARIVALGEVVPVWQATVRAQVGGRVEFVADVLRSGSAVAKGQALVRLERSAYDVQTADARSRLAVAKTELMQEEQRVHEARRNWERSGIEGEPGSPLALRSPQLRVAQSAVAAATTALVHAEKQVSWTEIRAPFDGVVVSRRVDLGETLFAGDEVAVVYGLEAVEVGIQLDATEWSLLPKPVVGARVRLRDLERQAEWAATVVRDSRRLDRETRLRTLFLQVGNPLDQTPPLLPGMFVRAELKGRQLAGVLCLPESALTKAGKVWFVDADDRLSAHRTEPLFRGEKTVCIPAPTGGPRRVAVAPNNSFVDGLLVQPVAAGKGE